MRYRKLILLILVSSLSVLSVVQGVHSQAPTTFTIGYTGPGPNVLNPLNEFNSGAIIVENWFYDPLVRYDRTLTGVEPDLAESWNVSSDGKVIVFNLIHNATWQDGTALTADDVAFTYNFEVKGQFPLITSYIANVNSSEVVDRYTVKVNLNRPDASAIDYMATNIYILPKHIWESIPSPGNYTNDHPVGSGPFILESWTPGQTVTATANPKYHYGRPRVDRIVYRQFSSVASELLALQNGEIDLTGPGISPEVISSLESNPNIKVIVTPNPDYWYLNFDMYSNSSANPTLRDKNVRLALLECINTTALTEIIYKGYAVPGTTIIPAAVTYWHNPNIQPYEINPTAAAALLDQNGYKIGSDGIRASSSGVKMSYTLYVPAGAQQQLRAAQQISQWWSSIGVKATPQTIDDDTLLAKIAKYEHDMFIWDWIFAGSPSPWLSIFLTSQLFILNDSGYSNPQYDQLNQQAAEALNPSARQAIIFQMQQLIHDGMPYGVLYYPDSIEAYRTDKFAGYAVMPGGPLYYYNPYTFLDVYPIGAVATTTAMSSSTTTTPTTSMLGSTETVLAEAVIIIVLVVALVATLVKRRKPTS
jgi:peptide/nickel transport system substrate-binding protein